MVIAKTLCARAAGVAALMLLALPSLAGANPGKGPRFLEYVSDILVFDSPDGLEYTFRYVLASAGVHAIDALALEDPRVQRVRNGDGEHVVMTYTHLPADRTKPWRIGVHKLRRRPSVSSSTRRAAA